MIVSKIRGGLGNQLFAYAAGRYLSNLHSTTLLLDTSWYRDGPRALLLPHFNISGEITAKDQSGAPDGIGFNQPHWNYYPEFTGYSGRRFLSGRWQSERFFEPVAGLIRRDLTFADPAIAAAAEAAMARLRAGREGPLVSMHCRRGDYVGLTRSKQFRLLGLQYYAEAMAQFPAGSSFVVFSDDPEWCRQNLLGGRCVPCGVEDPLIAFGMMRLCDHHIIANSTYSWWAAWLGETHQSKVVAPEAAKWFGPELAAQHDTRDVIPKRWIELPVED